MHSLPYTHVAVLLCLVVCLTLLASFCLSFFISLTCACLTFLTPQEKLFNLLLTERICPLIIKLFSPSSKYRHSPPTNAASPSDKPTFALSVRLLRILSVLIREFYTSLVGPCSRLLVPVYNVHGIKDLLWLANSPHTSKCPQRTHIYMHTDKHKQPQGLENIHKILYNYTHTHTHIHTCTCTCTCFN